MGTANVTLYAKWSANNYTVTFDKDDNAATGTMSAQTIASGSSANLTANAFSKTGWIFAGWATSSTGTVAYTDKASYIMGTANVILYAKWTIISYTLTVTTDGSGSVNKDPSQATYTYGTDVTLTPSPALGWVFDSWSGADSEDISTPAPYIITMDADKSITANFTKIFTIEDLKLHANLGSKSDEQGVWDLHVFILFSKNDLNKDGNFTIRIKSFQEYNDGTETVKWFPSESGTEPIKISPGQNRYPAGGDAWVFKLESAGTGQGKPKDVFVEIWIYDNTGNQVAYGSKYAN